jgi:putative flippase GtrA
MSVYGAVERTTRYTLVGAVCAATYNAIMIFGNWLGGNYVSLSVLAYFAVTPIGYLLHARFTFGVGRSWRDFARFASGIAASFPIYLLVMAGLCSGLHLSIPIAAPMATVAMYIWNYVSSHWALRSRLPFWAGSLAHEQPATPERPEDLKEAA